MATVHVGLVWNLQDCLVSSVPIKCMAHNFYPGCLSSGQFRDIPIISLWGIWKCFPFRINQLKPPNPFRSIATIPYVMIQVQLMIGGYGDVTWGQIIIGENPILASNSRHDWNRDAQMVPNDDRFVKPIRKICTLTYFGLWPDLDLTWPEV